MPVPSTTTFLRYTGANVTPPVILNLAERGLGVGDRIQLEMVGGFSYVGYPDEGWLLGVFSSTSEVLGPTNARRVPGALDAGPHVSTTGLGNDIPEDFQISYVITRPGFDRSKNMNGVELTVPAGAAYLMIMMGDDAYGDNGATNGLGVKVSRLGSALDDGNPCTLDACDPEVGVTHTPVAAGTLCGTAPAGECSAVPTCNAAGACLANYRAAGTVCRDAAGVCDVAEACDGASNACPVDGFQASGTECRASAGTCDPAEQCTGTGAACPVDTVYATPTVAITAGSGFAVDEGSSLTLTASTTGDTANYDYAWTGVTSSGATASFAATDGPATASVGVTVTDRRLASCKATSALQTLTVQNVAPTVSIKGSATNSYLEGAVLTFTSTVSDPSTADTASLVYAWSVTKGVDAYTGVTPIYSADCALPTCFQFTPSDNGAYVVSLTVTDKDGGAATATSSVVVDDVAPTATLSRPERIFEGTAASFYISAVADPSTADSEAGFHYAYSCAGSELLDQTYGSAGRSPSFQCTFAQGPSTQTVTARIFDKDGLSSLMTLSFAVENVAPVVTLTTTDSDEGALTTITASFTDPSGAADAHTCAVDFGDGTTAAGVVTWGSAGGLCTASHVYADNGSYTATVTVTDKDTAEGSKTATQVVKNVAPKADLLVNPAAINEGDTFTIALTNASDPGVNDTFTYAFDCGDGNGYNDFAVVASRACPTSDSSLRIVFGSIRDKDGATVEKTATVSINNVAPIGVFSGPSTTPEGTSVTLGFTGQFDPSGRDAAALRYAFDCEGGSLAGATYATSGTIPQVTCTYDDGPSAHVVSAMILDSDGGFSQYTTPVIVTNVAPTAVLSATATGGVRDDDDRDDGEGHGPGRGIDDAHADHHHCRHGSHHDCQQRDHDHGRGCQGSAGRPVVVSFSSPADPSIADTRAGFHYAFSCTGAALTATYATASLSATTTCTYPQNGTYTVTGRIYDQNGGFTEYTVPVTVGGSMSGGGKVGTLSHGFELRCGQTREGNLELNFPGGKFKLSDLTQVTCSDDPTINQSPRKAHFDTLAGAGTGRFNNKPGYAVSFVFTDAGEPGRNDRAQVLITSPTGAVVFSVNGTLTGGNHEAHKD